jgi:hypothetical protein
VVGWVPASEALRYNDALDELKEIKAENAQLREQIDKVGREGKGDKGDRLLELARTLSKIEVAIPDAVRSEGGAEKVDLFTLFINNADALVAGVTDSPFNDAAAQFLYYNLATKLKVHALMGDKRLVGKKISCLATTSLGDQLLAWYAKKAVEQRPTEGGTEKAGDGMSE